MSAPLIALAVVGGVALVAALGGKRFPFGPVDDTTTGRVTSPYGPRTLFGRLACHRGIDFARRLGANVYAVDAGRVAWVGSTELGGNTVVIAHPDGWTTYYLHLASVVPGVVAGADVVGGQLIAGVGSTGRSTGNHLHFAAKNSSDQWVDPGPLLGLPPGVPCD